MTKDLSREYQAALKDFLAGGGEASLKDAYLLGRQALEQGVGVLDLADIHHQALLALLGRPDAPARNTRKIIKQAGGFLAECLSPFEMAHRGLRENIAALNFLNEMLEDEIEKRTQEIRVTEERYRTLTEVSPDSITMTDLQGQIILCNQQSAHLHGYFSPEEMIGANSADFVSPEDASQVKEMTHRVVYEGIVGELQYTLVRKDNSRIPVEVRTTLVRDAQGRPSGFVGINRDISERKQAQLKLELQARRQAAVAEFGLQALSGMDLDTLMREAVTMVADTLYVQYCELLEWLPEKNALVLRDGIGWKEGMIGHAHIKVGEDSQAGYTLRKGGPVIVEDLAHETRFHPPAFLLEHNVISGITVIIHGKDEPYGVLGAHVSEARHFTSDEINFLQGIANALAMAIDNRRMLETEAKARQRAEEDKEQSLRALAIISHELRTPLTSIKGFAGTLLADDVVWDAEQQRDFIETINEEANKLSGLIEQLLDISRMDAGVFKFASMQQSPQDLVTEAMTHLQTLTPRHKLVIDVPDTLPQVMADTQRVGQVLSNLVENATKYTPAGTTISVLAQARDGVVEFSVADQGAGIAPEEREKIFHPFYRAGDKVTIMAKGAGLGLTICRKLVEGQGGRIWVAEQTGPGTVITFTLPVADHLSEQQSR